MSVEWSTRTPGAIEVPFVIRASTYEDGWVVDAEVFAQLELRTADRKRLQIAMPAIAESQRRPRTSAARNAGTSSRRDTSIRCDVHGESRAR